MNVTNIKKKSLNVKRIRITFSYIRLIARFLNVYCVELFSIFYNQRKVNIINRCHKNVVVDQTFCKLFRKVENFHDYFNFKYGERIPILKDRKYDLDFCSKSLKRKQSKSAL